MIINRNGNKVELHLMRKMAQCAIECGCSSQRSHLSPINAVEGRLPSAYVARLNLDKVYRIEVLGYNINLVTRCTPITFDNIVALLAQPLHSSLLASIANMCGDATHQTPYLFKRNEMSSPGCTS